MTSIERKPKCEVDSSVRNREDTYIINISVGLFLTKKEERHFLAN